MSLRQLSIALPEASGAEFSPCGLYRYRLWREVDPRGRGRCTFAMLNPSTADETANDPTVRRCIGFTAAWGFRMLEVVNIFAYRSTDPRQLHQVNDPVGPENDLAIAAAAKKSDRVVCAWGTHGSHLGRGEQVRAALHALGGYVYCLGTNGDGSPKHPLYLAAKTEPVKF